MPRLPSQAPFVIGFGFLLHLMSGPGQTGFISLFSGELQASMRLSAGELGTLYSLATLASAAALLLVGPLIDRCGFRFATLMIVGSFSLGGVLLGSATHWTMLLAGYFFLRVSANGSFPVLSRSLIVTHFVQNRGRALSLAQLGTPLGEAFLPSLAVVLMGLIGWRSTWIGTGLALPLLGAPFLLLFLRSAEKPVEKLPEAAKVVGSQMEIAPAPVLPVQGLSDILRDPRFLLLLFPLLYTPFTLSGLFFYSHALAAEKGWTLEWIARGFAAYGVLHAVGILCVGGLIDRLTARRVLAVHMLPMMVGVALLALIDHPFVVFAYLGLAGLSVGFGGTTKAALWPELYGTSFIARLNGLGGSLITLSTALGPPTFGFLIDHGVGLRAILQCVAAYGAICTLAAGVFLRFTAAKKRTGRF